MRFFRWYQFVVPIVLFPLSYLLWLRRYDGDHTLVWLALSLPVVFAYVVPGLGTNWLGLWEFNTRFRVGRFRPHHGFVFGTATSLFGLVCVPEAAPGFDLGDCLRAALVTGSVIGFWNWLYDIYAIKAGFIVLHTRLAAEGQPAEVVATSHAPVYFGVFGACYGVCLQLVDALSAGNHRGVYVALGVVGNLAAVVFPVLAYVLWSHATLGESGLRAYRRKEGVMRNENVRWLSLFLWIVCAFHVLVGLSLNVDLGFREWVGGTLYSAQVDWSDGQFAYILKPLGAFMIALGFMAAMAARDPLGHRSIIIGFAFLFTLRGLQRLLFLDEIERVFAISSSRSLVQMVVMLSLAVALMLLLRAASAGSGSRPVTAA